jgi:outer membrane lipase/esterase
MTVKWSDGRRRMFAGVAVCAGVLGTSCGGSTTAVSHFVPARIVSFGDESSLIIDINNDSNGAKYTVNATVSATDQTLVCPLNQIWNQVLAASYGLVFPECNPGSTAVTAPTSRLRATVGAVAVDLVGQIDAQQADSPLVVGDMVTVLVGENDIISQYLQYPVKSEAEITANLEAAGALAGTQVNRLADTGAKVLLATAQDVGYTPFAVSERNAHADTDRAAMLSRLSNSYNSKLRATIVNDGRKIGLVLLDELVSGVAKNPGLDGFTNTTDAVCDLTLSTLTPPSSLDCTTQTLIPGGSGAYFWADDRHLSAAAHNVLGSSAITRAKNNSSF